MRNQKRSFVVEYKSRRRSAMDGAKSIWADTDLKAIARDAEFDAPHLFKEKDLEPPRGEVSSVMPVAPSDHIETRTAVRHSPAAVMDQHAAYAEVLPPVPTTSGPVSEGASSATRRTANLSSRIKRRRKGTLPRVNPVEPSVEDELSALYRENFALKVAFKQQLLSENAALRSMLARFEVDL